jgi:hypothetical protein
VDKSLHWRFGLTQPSWLRAIEQRHGASFNTSVEDTSGERYQKYRQQSQADQVFQVVNCLIRRVEVPETLLEWSRLAREQETNEEKIFESELSDIVAKYCNLQASIESFQPKIDPVDALSQALNIESELVEWAQKWKAQDNYTTITIDKASADVLNDHWHLYFQPLRRNYVEYLQGYSHSRPPNHRHTTSVCYRERADEVDSSRHLNTRIPTQYLETNRGRIESRNLCQRPVFHGKKPARRRHRF